jgi:formylglycine-generating enzyme required for sulfatase activity
MFEVLMGYSSMDGESSIYGSGDNYPAYYVNWYMAADMANALSEYAGLSSCYTCTTSEDTSTMTYGSCLGNPAESTCVECTENPAFATIYNCDGYRLPTDGEWELAVRSGTTSEFWTGEGADLGGDYITSACNGTETIVDGVSNPLLGDYAWYCGNDSTYGSGSLYGSKEVAQLLPNGFGLYDMHGNVYEWSNDWWGSSYPTSTEDPIGASSGSVRVYRGGGWRGHPNFARASYRYGDYTFNRFDSFGFRLARTVSD